MKSSSSWSRIVVSEVPTSEPIACCGIAGRRLIMRMDASSLESSDHRSDMSGMKLDCVRVDCVPSTLLKFMLTSDSPRRVDGGACCCCQRLVWLKAAIMEEADENRSGACAGSRSALPRQEWTSSCSDGDGGGKFRAGVICLTPAMPGTNAVVPWTVVAYECTELPSDRLLSKRRRGRHRVLYVSISTAGSDSSLQAFLRCMRMMNRTHARMITEPTTMTLMSTGSSTAEAAVELVDWATDPAEEVEDELPAEEDGLPTLGVGVRISEDVDDDPEWKYEPPDESVAVDDPDEAEAAGELAVEAVLELAVDVVLEL